jgi:hypothetical protein
VTILNGCDNPTDFDNGPCKFAPPESKFPIFRSCEECYFNLKFQNKEYFFAGNQLESGGGGPGWRPERNILVQSKYNSFLSFYLVSPSSDELLNNSIGVKSALLESSAISKLNDSPPPVSVSLGIYNYCKTFFEPVTGDISQSYHLITKTELIQSSFMGSIGGSIEQYQNHIYYCYGEIKATFVINGENQIVTATYKVKAEIWEKL